MFEGERLIKRMAFVIAKGKIEKVFYPVFPPDKNADEVLNWIKSSQESTLLKLPSPTTNCD
jgi:peroxiredoxin